jgi:acetyl esterase
VVPADSSTDPHIGPQGRAFLTELNKDSSPFWELSQPKPQETVRYGDTIHDFSLLNAVRHVPSTEAALAQVSGDIRAHLQPDTHRAGRPWTISQAVHRLRE